MEEPSSAASKTGGGPGDQNADPDNESVEPALGAPRVHGELLKLGIDVCETTVARTMPRRTSDPCPTWKSFLNNHLDQTVALGFFVVPTLTFRILFVLVILAHDRRRVVHSNVTAHPTAEWTRQQLVEAFPWDSAPRYL